MQKSRSIQYLYKIPVSQYKNTNNLVEKQAKDMNIELMETNIQMAVF